MIARHRIDHEQIATLGLFGDHPYIAAMRATAAIRAYVVANIPTVCLSKHEMTIKVRGAKRVLFTAGIKHGRFCITPGSERGDKTAATVHMAHPAFHAMMETLMRPPVPFRDVTVEHTNLVKGGTTDGMDRFIRDFVFRIPAKKHAMSYRRIVTTTVAISDPSPPPPAAFIGYPQ